MSTITLQFPDASGTRVGTVHLSWIRGKPLRLYMKDPVVRTAGLVGMSFRCYIYNGVGRKVRLPYVPNAGDTITWVPTRNVV